MGDEWLVGHSEQLSERLARSLEASREEGRRKGELLAEAVAAREALRGLAADRVEAASAGGWDGISELVAELLGGDVWERALNGVPDDWEEEQAQDNILDALRRPDESPHFALFLSGPELIEVALAEQETGRSGQRRRQGTRDSADANTTDVQDIQDAMHAPPLPAPPGGWVADVQSDEWPDLRSVDA